MAWPAAQLRSGNAPVQPQRPNGAHSWLHPPCAGLTASHQSGFLKPLERRGTVSGYGRISPDRGVALVQMFKRIVKRSGVAVVAVALASCGMAYASAPPIPASTDSALTSVQKGELKAYVQYWFNRISATKSYRIMAHAANELLKPLKGPGEQPSAIFSYDYGTIVSRTLRPLLTDPERDLVAAVVLGRVGDLSTQSSLQLALQSKNAGVRYWGAVGLIKILPQLQSIPPAYQEAEDKLVAALQVEQSPLVAAKLVIALAEFSPLPSGVISSLVHILAAEAKLFSLRPPLTVAQAGELSQSLTALLEAQAHPTLAEKTQTATYLTQLLSFTCQYWAANELDRNQRQFAPAAMLDFTNALNALTGTRNFTIAGLSSASNKAATLLAVNELTGSQGQPGVIQKMFPKVPIPARTGGN